MGAIRPSIPPQMPAWCRGAGRWGRGGGEAEVGGVEQLPSPSAVQQGSLWTCLEGGPPVGARRTSNVVRVAVRGVLARAAGCLRGWCGVRARARSGRARKLDRLSERVVLAAEARLAVRGVLAQRCGASPWVVRSTGGLPGPLVGRGRSNVHHVVHSAYTRAARAPPLQAPLLAYAGKLVPDMGKARDGGGPCAARAPVGLVHEVSVSLVCARGGIPVNLDVPA